jgi:hypothetical protein
MITAMRERLRVLLGHPVGWWIFQLIEFGVLLWLMTALPEELPVWSGVVVFLGAVSVTFWANLRLLAALGLRSGRRGARGA